MLDQLRAQLDQLNEHPQSVLDRSLRDLQDYQANRRRVRSLFQNILSSETREGWWEAMTGYSKPTPSSAPLAYEDLYPNDANIGEWNLKKSPYFKLPSVPLLICTSKNIPLV